MAPVQLTYAVKLTNPQTTPGTYGTYDARGEENYQGLYTNNSATLYPVDSNHVPGEPETFAKPTVSYTVPESTIPTDPEPGNPDASVDIDKTATDLVNDQTKVTLTVGADQETTGEGASRTELRLTREHVKYAEKMNSEGKKIILVVFAGRPGSSHPRNQKLLFYARTL